jgi:putative flippase GtrA
LKVSGVQGQISRYVNQTRATMPAFMRFGIVGGTGLITDTLVFTVFYSLLGNPFLARLLSLAVATVVTWSLNRHLTFDIQERKLGHEAMRYIAVTLFAQGFSYSIFAGLVTFLPNIVPQLALVAGALAGAVLSFNGHRIVSFAPVKNSLFGE